MGSMFPPSDSLAGLGYSLRFKKEQGDVLRKMLDRAAFIAEQHANVLAKSESPGPVQTDEEREARKGRGGRPKRSALDLARAL